ncbi:MAG: glutamic protease [Lentinula lateritia]|uniref:Peptidase A4 family-domain-containing protein n=1 Tax=Lentinula lateritia TaxID=40482 RepID=A0ABQ8V9W5_9AGAR|nr:glutamic protease [Lentinula novae-zelandiae]KAJ3926398.1 MAG: glutamic protease [Lentinula lateritia]KAJ4483116.1 peptidase A4 family-domain-containing protein [Lentinula lateritia]
MKFLTFSLISVLFVSRGFAWPSRLANREASRRLRGSRPLSSSPHAVVNSTSNGTDSQSDPKSYAVTSSGTTLYDEYSTNWAGVVIESPPTGQNFTTVSGTFIVPKPTGSNGSASAWVGIDGDTASQSILQAGVDFTISGGKVSYDSWYEWYPNYAYDFSNFAISAGNTITITIHSTSSKAGVVTLLNKSTGKSVSQSLTAPSSSTALKGQNAEWIVEDYEQNGSLVPFANFGTVTFTNASASTLNKTLAPNTGIKINIVQSKKLLTSTSFTSNSVTVKHT